MAGYLIFDLCLLVFQVIWAGVLTIRVAEYGFCGTLPGPAYLVYWILFFFTGIPLLLVALPFRLIGIKIYPAFVPERQITGNFDRGYDSWW